MMFLGFFGDLLSFEFDVGRKRLVLVVGEFLLEVGYVIVILVSN